MDLVASKKCSERSLPLPRLMVSAASKSSGKTVVTLGLLRYFSSRGERVTSFKKGPDYIDPMWHRRAGAADCRNLDPWMMGRDVCRAAFSRTAARHGGIALLEGNHGLHDGMDLDGEDSSAGLASLLDAPVLLVLDSRKMNRGAAALVLGLQVMVPRVRIGGVILNQVAGRRQESKQKLAIERFCNVPVLGSLPKDEALRMPERHLGLITVDEAPDAGEFIRRVSDMVEHHCDMAAIRELFQSAPPMEIAPDEATPSVDAARARIGVFRDPAFCFYYPDNLEALRASGAELVFIDSFTAGALPDIDGLYLGGGFPESFFGELSAQTTLLRDVRERIDGGLPAWAECGGLIYLSASASRDGRRWPLAGALPLDIRYQRRPAGCGYVSLESRIDSPWFGRGERLRGHEFHYSRPAAVPSRLSSQFELSRGFGLDGRSDGILHRNLFASYSHLHAAATPWWAGRFVSLAASFRDSGSAAVA